MCAYVYIINTGLQDFKNAAFFQCGNRGAARTNENHITV